MATMTRSGVYKFGTNLSCEVHFISYYVYKWLQSNGSFL